MAASVTPPVTHEYVRIFDLPSASLLPDELRGRVLFSRANFVRAKPSGAGNGGSDGNSQNAGTSSSQKDNGASRSSGALAGRGRGRSSGTGFNYSKALNAALDGAGSSVVSRGDGKFQDGRDFAVSDAPGGRAKFVHLTPEALAPGNAEMTLQHLDQLQQMAGGRPGGGASRPAGPLAPSRSVQQQHAAALAAAANILYDINDDDAGGGGRSAATSSAAAATVAPHLGEGPAGLRTPEFTLRELPDGPMGQGQLEVSIQMPDVATPGEVDVWLGGGGVLQLVVPGKYQLKLDLPYPVLDDTSAAKWSKAKKRLTLTLSRERGR